MSEEQQWEEALAGRFHRGDVIASKYRLDRIIGVGGMGVIVEAMHVALEEKVAVKLLRPTRTSEDARERFRREARAAFRLTSEHAARVIDLGEEGDSLYMVMELLEGHDLGQLLEREKRIPVSFAVGYVLQACEAVAEAHALGIVHRDLKPENLFLCRRADGTPCVKVLDFGLAKMKAPEDRASLTRVNRGMGTPHYMAPEQWLSARDVGPGSDIWALGVILYHLMAGARPFDEEDEGALSQAILFGEPTGLDRFVPNPPRGLAEILAKCLEKKPENRWPSVAAFAAALAPYAPTAEVDGKPGAGMFTDSSWGLSVQTSGYARSDSATNVLDMSRPRSVPPGRPSHRPSNRPSARPSKPGSASDRPPPFVEDTSQPMVVAGGKPERSFLALAAVAALVLGGALVFVVRGATDASAPVAEPAPAASVPAPPAPAPAAPKSEDGEGGSPPADRLGEEEPAEGEEAARDDEAKAEGGAPPAASAKKKPRVVPYRRRRPRDEDIYDF
ncbi:MAG: serine/threonine protein kinase [Myxococcales bacterium]|nr:serine/threonine protein kinase [Myxococcales bacterium]